MTLNDFAQTLVDGLKLHEEVTGAIAEISGTPYPCCGGEELTSRILSAGGFSERAAVTIILRTEVFAGALKSGQRVNYTSTPGAQPIDLKISPSGVNTLWNALLVLSCEHPAQKL